MAPETGAYMISGGSNRGVTSIVNRVIYEHNTKLVLLRTTICHTIQCVYFTFLFLSHNQLISID